MSQPIPVALFAYNRPDLLSRTLAALRVAEVPLIYTFSDGAKTPAQAEAVDEVRRVLRAIDWCEIVPCERPVNLGLGISIRTGVTEVLRTHESLLVVEDDLICVSGTYRYLSAALQQYREDPRVMSVTGWNHPRVTPADLGAGPYFDGRAECLFWGTWQRAWQGMEQDAQTLITLCRQLGIDTYSYGADVPVMAVEEQRRNIWAVRWLLLHMLRGRLCLRPPYSMVEHIGFDSRATNATDGIYWANPPLRLAPAIPDRWPEPYEHPDCSALWQQACGKRPKPLLMTLPVRAARKLLRIMRSVVSSL